MRDSNGMTIGLEFPTSSTIHVYRDNPECRGRLWWEYLREDYVCTYSLPTDEFGEVEMTGEQWNEAAAELERRHPGCLFVYY